jgi:6-phosphogluconolactonase
VSTLPADFQGVSWVAEIRVHPNGRTVFVSNRGHDSLAVFARDAATGRLTLEQTVSCGGSHPRSFALSPDGAWLVCAHQKSDTLAVFSIDQTTGKLTRTGALLSAPSPVCVIFASAPLRD